MILGRLMVDEQVGSSRSGERLSGSTQTGFQALSVSIRRIAAQLYPMGTIGRSLAFINSDKVYKLMIFQSKVLGGKTKARIKSSAAK